MYYPPNCSFPIICRIDEEENAKNHYQRSQPILLYVHTSTTSCWMERSLDLLVQNKVPMLPKLELVSSFLLFSRQNAPVTITQPLSSKTNNGIYRCTRLAIMALLNESMIVTSYAWDTLFSHVFLSVSNMDTNKP